ncbi:methyltransferase domain-containing protein [Nocardiopsis sp. RSe5-2]|uniref:Protein-L-isoaspartate O-methyltransferase n=1 Tax=Nocardiopsis endophytica TaxID=3018445 RepID=A0ABT4UEB7_9ACTN|nr:methyltransferase domain-containing protein [Nocardiopsis endophytica]MDA2815273.1 methyltransferase domain-containing protein [Nocardiopsis endophytica]
MADADADAERLATLAAPDWDGEFRAVPREHFIPERARATPMDGSPSIWIDRSEDPGRWRAAVYSDATVLTQVDDGATDLAPGTTALPTSSSTAPGLVLEFLRLLAPTPGDRVLEIGTGTGWTAGLLAARLGEDRVTTVEVDAGVAAQAAENLKRTGFAPHLIVGDGACGHPEGAPFDRVHVTCAVTDIPAAWVEQLRPGGLIALPWAPVQAKAHKVVLTGLGEGRAVGRFHGDTAFMMLRSQRRDLPRPAGEARESHGRIDPMRIASADRGLEVVATALLPGVAINALGTPDDRIGLWDPVTGSYALAVRIGGGAPEVDERGPRSLWSEMEEAYLKWLAMGAPGRDRLGLLIDRQGRHVWLDRPDNVIGESI